MKTRSLLCALLLPGFATLAAPALGPLRVHPTNPRYFTNGSADAAANLNIESPGAKGPNE